MLTLLADGPITAPAEIVTWLGCLGFVLWIWNQAAVAVARGKPTATQKREIVGDSITVKKASEAASSTDLERVSGDVQKIEESVRDDVKTLHKKIDDLHGHVSGSERRLAAAGEERITRLQGSISNLEANLHNRVTDVANRISHLEGVVEVIRAKK